MKVTIEVKDEEVEELVRKVKMGLLMQATGMDSINTTDKILERVAREVLKAKGGGR